MTDLICYDLFIGGQWTPSDSGATFRTMNPYTGADWAEVPDASESDVDRAVAAAKAALAGEWGRLTGFERARLMRTLARVLERDADDLARVEARDNGKLLREMRGQMAALPQWLDYFAGIADKIHGETIPAAKPNYFIYTRYEPVGVVAAIVPWNSPLLLLMWKLAAAWAAGCPIVVKPSESTPASVLEFAKRVEEVGFPPGAFNVVTGSDAWSGQWLVQHPDVDRVAFTGSTEVGIRVAQSAAGHLARVSLELGGKSPQIVFDDAHMEAAVNGIVAGVFAATGQTCIAGSRLLVQEGALEPVMEGLVSRARTIKLGDPFDAQTEMGPVANVAQFQKVTTAIRRASEDGARVVCGGPESDLGGLFVPPTIITDVRPDMSIVREEVFGPVLAVMPFKDEDEAIALANSSRYGLAAGVWTTNVGRAHRVAHRLRAGTVWINSYRAVAPNAPFGGFGLSGWGRESGRRSVYEYLETKTVWLDMEGVVRDPFVLG